MNDIVQIDNLSSLSVADLKAELARGLEITTRHLRYLASVWRELEDRGEDLSDIRHGLLAYLPMIANETVEPQIIVSYAGQKKLLSTLAAMPVDVQRNIVKTGYIQVAADDCGSVEVPVNSLKVSDMNKIFDVKSGRVRTPDEQVAFIKNAPVKSVSKKHITSIIGFDRQDDCELIVISGKRAKIARILTEIATRYPDKAKELLTVADRF